MYHIVRKFNHSKYFFFREDFTKVFDVVREQIEKALLTKNNGGPKTFEEFKNRVSHFSLWQVKNLKKWSV